MRIYLCNEIIIINLVDDAVNRSNYYNMYTVVVLHRYSVIQSDSPIPSTVSMSANSK